MISNHNSENTILEVTVMEFKRVVIQNFKGIENMELTFFPGVNLILGENGVGKTSVLEAMTIAFGDFFNGIAGVNKRGILHEDIHFRTSLTGDASTKIEYCTPTTVRSEIHLDKATVTGEVTRRDETSQSRTKYLGKECALYARKICNDMHSILPLLCYFSTSRMAQSKREDFGTASKNKLNDRRIGYIGCIENNLDRKALEAWCLKMEQAEFKKKGQVQEYSVFKAIVSTFMKNMNELDITPTISYSDVFDDMVYEEKETITPIKYLSAGYQSLLWIIMMMAFRICQLNPTITDYQAIPGIVLIDEIDMHLHPRWQWRIVDALKETFPNVQFILATHAPIIISSCKEAHLIQIDDDHTAQYLPSAYAFSIDDVAELTQGSSGIPIKLKRLSRAFERAFFHGDKESATDIYEKMLEQFGESNTEVDLAKRRLSIL